MIDYLKTGNSLQKSNKKHIQNVYNDVGYGSPKHAHSATTLLFEKTKKQRALASAKANTKGNAVTYISVRSFSDKTSQNSSEYGQNWNIGTSVYSNSQRLTAK